jgi:penicillin-insensitive murein endopeptidase
MNKFVCQFLFVYLAALFLMFAMGCGPRLLEANNPQEPEKEISYESEAKSTVIVPQLDKRNNFEYQPPARSIINNQRTEIILGETELRGAKISYNSTDRKMQISGVAFMMNDKKEKVAEKAFSLVGTHKKNENTFILNEEDGTEGDKKLKIKAVAHCLTQTASSQANCNQVAVDVYILFNKKYYTEQLELKKPEAPAQVTPIQSTPTANTPALAPPEQHEDEDQADNQQPEESDGSIEGRFQGVAETVDLSALFSEPANLLLYQNAAKPSEKLVLNLDIQQTLDGELRPVNQATGFPDAGSLRNSTSVLQHQQALNSKAFFEVVSPSKNKHFATYEMAEIIARIGDTHNRQYEKKIYVSNFSAVGGGKLSPHASHQNGLDVDIGYPTDLANIKFPLVVRMATGEYFSKNYSIDKTYNLFKYLFSQKDIPVDRIFVDQKIRTSLCNFAIAKNEFKSDAREVVKEMFENIQHVTGHGDHFHLRIKCSKYDPACRGRIYRKMETCGQ